MKYSLFLDDERFPDAVKWVDLPRKNWRIARNFDQFVFNIEFNGLPEFISFDHDLGADPRTGLDCAKWLLKYCLRNNKEVPEFKVHSMNPIGAENIKCILNNCKRMKELGYE